MTVLTRCNCDIDNSVSSMSGMVTTMPGACPSVVLNISPSTTNHCPGDMFEVAVTVENFVDIATFQFTIDWDDTVLQLGAPMSSLSGIAFGLTGTNFVSTSWFSVTPLNLADGDTLMTLSFTAIGSIGSSSNISFSNSPTNIEVTNSALTILPTTTNNETITIPNSCPPMTTMVCINEVDADTPGNDDMEFVELSGPPNAPLDGLVVVFFNGSNDQSYNAFDLDGLTLDANGFFVLGNAAVPGVDLVFPNNGLQNGADAVAVYAGNATDFPNGTPPTTTNLIDAIVYDTNDADDMGLLTGLGQTTQYNEDANGNKDNESISRTTDCGPAIATQAPTPGVSNVVLITCPTGLSASTADPVGVINSICPVPATMPSGGSFTAIMTCPIETTAEYSTDGGATWSSTLPTYNQSIAMTVLTRCNCDVDNNISSMTASVTTMPATCCQADAGDLLPMGPLVVCEGDDTPEFTADYSAADEIDPNAGAGIPPVITLTEIRIDQPGSDDDEYLEICGPPGSSLNNLTLIVLGDNNGEVENATSLAGQVIPTDGCLLVAESSFSMGTPDFIASLNFENSDNLTFLLVENFTGMVGDDLDADDDGVLDTPVPWTSIISEVALVETPGSGDAIYSSITVGPDGLFVPGHVALINGVWQIGTFDPADPNSIATPGSINSAPAFSYIWVVTQVGATPFDIVTSMQGAFGAPYGATFSGLAPGDYCVCLLYTSPSPRDATLSRMPSSA